MRDLSARVADGSLPLDKVNEAISGIAQRNGGFSNFVINP